DTGSTHGVYQIRKREVGAGGEAFRSYRRLKENKMPSLNISPDLNLHYLVDDFTDPWTKPETILLLHGNSESSAAWYAWVPLLARRFRVVRPDMRGYGASTPMPREFKWSLDVIIDDYTRLMDSLGVPRFHLVGAKIGGINARAV